MALKHNFHPCQKSSSYIAQSSGERKESFREVAAKSGRSPADEFSSLAATFQRRLVVGVGSASLVAVGANFGGVTSFLLGLSPENGRNLKLDILYPIKGYSRCIDTNEGFEFIYPASWVGDQRLLYRAAEKSEFERSLDPPPLNNMRSNSVRRGSINEPVVAFGPPGPTGELNVSVIVSPVSPGFAIEAFGGPKEVGEAVVRTITRSGRQPNVKGTLMNSTVREDKLRNVKYYALEFKVESPSFKRHNVAVCCASNGKLYTLNAQAPELAWPDVKLAFYTIADSFNLNF